MNIVFICHVANVLAIYLSDTKDVLLSESRRRVDLLEESMVDYESTISQFRDLVINLQRRAALSCVPQSADEGV